MLEQAQPSVETTEIMMVGDATLTMTEQWLIACEYCASNATVALDYLLDALLGCDPMTEYVMCRPARCPSCSSAITEKTLVVV